MSNTKITSKILADNAAQENLNAGASITLTKPVSLTSGLNVDGTTTTPQIKTLKLQDSAGSNYCEFYNNTFRVVVNNNPFTFTGNAFYGDVTGRDLGTSSSRFDAFLRDVDIIGTVTATNLVYNAGDQNIAGDKTFTDDVAVVGTLTTTDKLTANGQGSFSGLGAKEALVKEHVSDPLFPINRTAWLRELMWSTLQARVLGSGSTVTQGTGGSASASLGYPSAQLGTSYSARAMGGTESGISRMSGSGASWIIPESFSVSAGMTMLIQHYNYVSSNITAGSNTFTQSNASSTMVGSHIWSSAFPAGTRVTAVNGTTVTASQNAISTPGANHAFVVSYDGVARFWMSNFPSGYLSGLTGITAFQKHTPFCNYTYDTAEMTAGTNTIRLRAPLTIASTVVVQGQTYVTIPAANSAITVGSTISGVGIPANTFVGSVTGNPAVTINMVDSLGNPVAATSGGTVTIGIGYVNMVGSYVYGNGIPNGTTITAIAGRANVDWMDLTVSQNVTETYNTAAPTPVSFCYSYSENYRNNNGFGFEVRPNPATGKIEFRLACMRAGALTYSNYAPILAGEITDWGAWYQFVMDYSSTTSQLRLWVNKGGSSNITTPARPESPTLTLAVPADMPTRYGGGTQFVVQVCANGVSPPANSTMWNFTLKDPMYFPNITAAP